MENNKRKISWAELPEDILRLIVRFLDDPLLIRRFRAMCKTWRMSCPLPLNDHLLSNHFPRVFNDSRYITASRTYLIEPLKHIPVPSCWLVTVDELNSGKLSFRYPLSKYPVLRPPDNISKVVNLLDFKVTELASSYVVDDGFYQYMDYRGNYIPIEYLNENKLKVISFSNSYSASNFIAILGQQGHLIALNLSENKWSQVHDGENFKFDDIVSYKGKIYGVERRGKLYSFEYGSFEITKITSQIVGGGGRRKRLVVCGIDLYLVTQDKSQEFVLLKAYKLSIEEGKWIQATDLNGHVFFVGSDCSFSLPDGVHFGFQEGCIYTFRDSFRLYSRRGDSNRQNRLIRHPMMYDSIGAFQIGVQGNFGPNESFELLWPPPPWMR